jgi:hypothetical protein
MLSLYLLGRALNCLTRGGVCTARRVLKEIWRAFDLASIFLICCLPGIFL